MIIITFLENQGQILKTEIAALVLGMSRTNIDPIVFLCLLTTSNLQSIEGNMVKKNDGSLNFG